MVGGSYSRGPPCGPRGGGRVFSTADERSHNIVPVYMDCFPVVSVPVFGLSITVSIQMELNGNEKRTRAFDATIIHRVSVDRFAPVSARETYAVAC